MYRRLWIALLLASCLPANALSDETPDVLDLAGGRFRVALEWAEEPAGELWTQDLGGEGGMFGATDGGEAARLEVAEILAGKVRARYRADERVAAFVVTHIPSGVTRRIEVSGGGVLELDPAAFAAEAAAKVAPVLDTARAVSAFLGPNGGVVTATDAGGVKFTLTLPKGALLTTQEIILTPLTGLGEFPFTPGLVAAVAVEPEGLRLWKLSTLEVETPAPVPLAERVAFGFRPANGELFLVPPAAGSVLKIKLTRLCGLGVGRGTDAEVAAQLKRTPSHPSDRLDQFLAQAAKAERLSTGGQEFDREKKATCSGQANALVDFFKKSIEKKLSGFEKKLKSKTATCANYADFLESEHAYDLHAGESSKCAALKKADSRLQAAHRAGLIRCFNDNYTACVQLPGAVKYAHELLGVYRVLQSYGLHGLVDAGKIAKCVRFELHFSSELTTTSLLDELSLRFKVKSTVPIRKAPGNVKPTGKAPTVWDSTSCVKPRVCGDPPHYTCSISAKNPGAFDVASLELRGSFFEAEWTKGQAGYDTWLDISPGNPTVHSVEQCGQDKIDLDDLSMWLWAWSAIHSSELRLGVTWLITGWDYQNQGISALKKLYVRPGVLFPNQILENTSLVLLHEPQP